MSAEPSSPAPRPLVLGLEPELPQRVASEALAFARDLGCPLVCVYVDETRIPVGEQPDGSLVTAPLAADGDWSPASLDALSGSGVAAALAEAAASTGVTVVFRAMAGDPALALARLAHELDARAIVIGTRRPGVRSTLELLLSGAIASRLARRQHVPVIVVPVHDREVPL